MTGIAYNLAENIGQANDRSPDFSDKVAAMDRLIEQFLEDSGSIVPTLRGQCFKRTARV